MRSEPAILTASASLMLLATVSRAIPVDRTERITMAIRARARVLVTERFTNTAVFLIGARRTATVTCGNALYI
ncbi:hypothetical protein Q8004_05565 [Edwardsiella piscicida]|nr:hypothetical protein Q8004_05565 [Edwardsiella piscicida]